MIPPVLSNQSQLHLGGIMKTEIVCIIDRSGSMNSIKDDAIGGFNTFLETQKAEDGEATFTMVLFDNEIITIYDGANLQSVEPLTNKTFVPRGNTALYDAICTTIDRVGQRLAKMPETKRPNQVLVAILTDGQENASTHHTHADARTRIEHQTNVYKWEFMFLAANMNAESVAATFSIDASKAYTFAASAAGSQDVFKKMAVGVAQYRATSELGEDWKKD